MKVQKRVAAVVLAGGLMLGFTGTASADKTSSGDHPNGNASCFGLDEGTGVGDASIQKNNKLGKAISGAAKHFGGVGPIVATWQGDCPR